MKGKKVGTKEGGGNKKQTVGRARPKNHPNRGLFVSGKSPSKEIMRREVANPQEKAPARRSG